MIPSCCLLEDPVSFKTLLRFWLTRWPKRNLDQSEAWRASLVLLSPDRKVMTAIMDLSEGL